MSLCSRLELSHASLCRRMCVLEATRAQFTTWAGKYLIVRMMSVASCLDLERPAGGFEAFEGGQPAGSNALKNRWLGRGCESWCQLPGKGLRFEAFEGGQTAGSIAFKNWLGRGCESWCQLPGKVLRDGLKRLRARKRQA